MEVDNFKAIYKILVTLEQYMDCEKVDIRFMDAQRLGVSQLRWEKYIEMMLDVGYIKNVHITESIIGEKVVDTSNIQITLKGLEYLQENNIMRKMLNLDKGIKDFI